MSTKSPDRPKWAEVYKLGKDERFEGHYPVDRFAAARHGDRDLNHFLPPESIAAQLKMDRKYLDTRIVQAIGDDLSDCKAIIGITPIPPLSR